MTRRRLAILAVAFFAARLLLVLCAADRLSEPDAAETKLMAIGDEWVADGFPGVDRVLRHVRAGTNAPHGAYLPVSLLYALFVVPFGAAGSYLALKLVAILFATIGLVAWTATANHLGGPKAAAVTAALLFVPPPGFLAGTMVPWGSHPESAALVGVVAWALTSGRVRSAGDAVVAGLLAGLVAGANLLVAPLLLVAAALPHLPHFPPSHGGEGVDAALEPDDTPTFRGKGGSGERGKGRWTRPGGLAVGSGVGLGFVLWVTGGLTASVTETAGASPLELASGGAAEGLFRQAASGLLPVGAWISDDPAMETLFGWLLTAVVAAVLVLVVLEARRRTAAVWVPVAGWLLAAPLVHLAVVCALAPRRPFVPDRYLLVLVPISAVAFGVAVAWTWTRPRLRPLALALAAAWGLAGAVQQVPLLDVSRIDGFAEYRPKAWVASDIGHVTYEEAPWVNAFVDRRPPHQRDGFGFAAGAGAADSALRRRARGPLDPRDLMERRTARLGRHLDASLAERQIFHENLGWSLSVFAWDRPGVWHAVRTHLDRDDDRASFARGLGVGLGLRGDAGCALARQLEFSAPVLDGAASVGGCGELER